MTETAMGRILNIYDDMKEYIDMDSNLNLVSSKTRIRRCVYDIFTIIGDNISDWNCVDEFIIDIITDIFGDSSVNTITDIQSVMKCIGIKLPLLDIIKRAKLKKYDSLVKDIEDIISIKSKTLKSTYLKLGYTRGATRGLIKQDLLNLYDSSYMISN